MDIATRWLQENDPYYKEKGKDDIEYPYLTEDMLTRRRVREIPFSSLNLRGRQKILQKNIEEVLDKKSKVC